MATDLIARAMALKGGTDPSEITSIKADIQAIQGLIPSSASPENQLADKAYVSAMQSGSPYTYMTQAEYEALTEYEPDRLYWVTYPLSKCHLIWCNGECVDGIGANEGTYSYKYMAIAYSPTGSNTRNIKKIDIAKGVTIIGKAAFSDCTSLTDIIIPEGVTSIADFAFRRCTSLTDIIIPEGVTKIGDNSFLACRALTSITLPSTVTSMSSNALVDCAQSNLTITINKPSGSISGSPWGATNATIIWAG